MVSVLRAEIFISHSSKNRKACATLRERLQRQGFHSLFLDFDPHDGIPPGRDWEQELYGRLQACDAVVALDTADWRKSPWCFAEIVLARSLGKTVIVLRQTDAAGKVTGPAALVQAAQSFRLLADEAGNEPFYRELARLGLGGLGQFRWQPGRAPYPGLAPLQEADAGTFFGRDRELRTVLGLLERMAMYADKAMVAVIGPSGCGKSSLLRAGVLPQLRQRSGWQVVGPMAAHAAQPLALETIGVDGPCTLFALDQLDEALADDAFAASPLATCLVELAQRHRGRAVVIATLRIDAVEALDRHLAGIAPRIERHVVGPLTRGDYRDIITLPAQAAGFAVDPDLADALLADVAASGWRADVAQVEGQDAIGADALPLLAATLHRLWERRGRSNRLSLNGYVQLGGLRGAIARAADEVLQGSAIDDAALESLRQAFLGMVRVDFDGRLTRRPLPLVGLDAALRPLIDRFVDEGLLVSGATPGHVELAHEALIRTWPKLAGWVAEAREDMLRLQRLELALALWDQRPEALLEGLALSEAEELAARGHAALRTQAARRLLHESRAQRELSIARDQQRVHALQVSESLRLAAEARDSFATEPATALRVAWEAVLRDRNPMAEEVFREALRRMPAPVHVLRDEDGSAWEQSMGFSADGTAAYAVAGRGPHVQLWGRDGAPAGVIDAGCEPIRVAPVHGRRALLIAGAGNLGFFGLNGDRLATLPLPGWKADAPQHEAAGLLRSEPSGLCVIQQVGRAWVCQVGAAEGSLRLVATFRLERERGLTGIRDMVVDASGRLLTTASSNRVCGWSLEGEPLFALARSSVASAEFLADGRMVTGTMDGEGALWHPDGTLAGTFREATGLDLFVRAVGLRCRQFVTASNERDGALELWDDAGQQVALLDRRGQHYWCAALSPDERWLAAGCADGAVRIWDRESGGLTGELHGHGRTVAQLAFSSDGADLLSMDRDGAVRLWSLGREILPTLPGHAGGVLVLQALRDGWLSSGKDYRTRAWRADAGTLSVAGRWLAHWEQDGGVLLLSQEQQGPLRLWRVDVGDAGERREVARLAPRQLGGGEVVHAVPSPDGSRWLLVGDEAAWLWKPGTDRVVRLVGPDSAGVELGRTKNRGAGFNASTGEIVTCAQNGMVWTWSPQGQLTGSWLADTSSPDRIFDLAVNPQGQEIACGVRHEVPRWNWQGEPLTALRTHGYKVFRVAYSPDGERILTIGARPSGRGHFIVELWDRSGGPLGVLDVPTAEGRSRPSYDPQHRYLVVPAEDLRVFDRDGALIGVIAAGRGASLRFSALSPDGELVAALFSDGSVRIWKWSEQRHVMTLHAHAEGPILFSPDGRRLLCATADGDIEQQALDIADLFAGAALRLDRGFDADEVRRFSLRRPVRLDLLRYR